MNCTSVLIAIVLKNSVNLITEGQHSQRKRERRGINLQVWLVTVLRLSNVCLF